MRHVLLIFLLVALTFGGAACSGTYNAPSVKEIEENSQLVDFHLPNGRTLPCLFYSARGSEGYAGHSWLVLDCDWSVLHQGQ